MKYIESICTVKPV